MLGLLKAIVVKKIQEHIPIDEVFENLRCSHEGLTSEQAQQRLQIFGPNKLEEKEVRFIQHILLLGKILSFLFLRAVMFFSLMLCT